MIYLKLKDYFLTHEKFDLVKDPESQILITKPQPSALDKYYESEEYLSHSSENKTLFQRCYQWAKYRNLISKVSLFNKYIKEGKVLDIGAGIGDLVNALSKEGYHATGMEPSIKAREVALKNNITLKSSTSTLTSHDYDAISMYHVLEHVPDLQKQKNEVNRLLKKEGYLILALPNYNSWDAQWFKKYWAAYDVPRHLYHFNQHAVSYFFKEHFEIVAKKPLWFDSLYVSILSARYKKLPCPFIVGVLIGLWSNTLAIFTGEYSSITYILKKRN